eukprot:CAMPEP_0113514048 /NCGR_PEP_ID=MMETSP0014_2-20120614/40196_1 /TAXON_ID=2857 /ORGANISM="Nitzschia sp." /LENGTH=246 /DNA_ID=CAMNT_0000410509 /DNA_START=1947 /DNA_END=2684 /DNA_ORIENTATION=- /assembly_acc=CAM_ASM_000159
MTDNCNDDTMSRLKAIEEEKALAYKLLQATLRTDTLVDELDSCTGQEIRETIEILVNRSVAMGIPELKKKAVQFAKLVVVKCPSHAVSVLLAIDRSIDFDDNDLTDLIMQKIRGKPDMMISNEEVKLLSEDQVATILNDKEMEATESTLFRILLQWIGSSDERRLIAREKLLKHIDLMLISPAELASDGIRKSGIVTDTVLFEIVVKQIKQGIPSNDIPRATKSQQKALVWDKANSKSFSNLTKTW